MKVGKKVTRYGTVYFTEGHVDKVEFISEITTKKRPYLSEIHYMYSDMDSGRYGCGRRFWKKNEKGTEPMTVWLPRH